MSEDIKKLSEHLNEFNSDEPDNGWQACMNLAGGRQSTAVLDILRQALNSETTDAATRAQAAEALGTSNDEKSIEALMLSLKNKKNYRLIRTYSAKSLGKCRSKNSIDGLLDIIKDENVFFGLTSECIAALAEIWVSLEDGQDKEKIFDELLKIGKKEFPNNPIASRVIRELRNSLNKIKKTLLERLDKINTELEKRNENYSELTKEKQRNMDAQQKIVTITQFIDPTPANKKIDKGFRNSTIAAAIFLVIGIIAGYLITLID